jgi:rubrerythrin
MLTAALAQETMTVRFYQQVLTQCDEPDVHNFVRSIVEERSASVIRIMQKLNEIKARSQTMDGIHSSFQS